MGQPTQKKETLDPSSARARLHHAIRRHFSGGIAAHYSKHPEWMDDVRGRAKIAMMLKVMHDVLNEVDQYQIIDKPPKELDCERL